ncbi:MAG: hypothetical protein ACR2N8_03590 [Parvibaculales bacterium]
MPKIQAQNTSHALGKTHARLAQNLLDFEAQIPKDINQLTEEFERYAKTIEHMIRAMEILMRRDDKIKEQGVKDETEKNKHDLLGEIERALDRIAGEDKT